MEQNILSVSNVNEYIKAKMERDELLSFLCVRGEISNYKLYPSGHHYFTLKDEQSALRCVMFKGSALRLRFRPENGMKILAFGRISVFPRDGAYQLYCEQLSPEGTGDLHVAFEQLKAKLQAQGLFDPAHKKPIPRFPQRIAIVTSSAGAAIHDMLRIIGRRYPLTKVLLLPVRVQGKEAPAEICGAIRYVNQFKLADLIITGRGGGSLEDLWAFNDEQLAYTVYHSEIPVISAVGHEPDVTICDYVADLRAATPSNGAELAVPDQMELRQRLDQLQGRVCHIAEHGLKLQRQRLNALVQASALNNPDRYLQDRRTRLENLQNSLLASGDKSVSKARQRFAQLAASLDAMSPLKVLGRGYSVVKSGDKVLTSVSQVHMGDMISVQLHTGRIDATVCAMEGEENE